MNYKQPLIMNEYMYAPRIKIMRYIQLYLVITVFLYAFGPIDWNTKNSFITFFLLIVYQMAFFLGYYYAESRPIANKKVYFDSEWLLRVFKVLVLIAIVMNLIYLIRVARLVSNRSVIEVIIASITDASSLYSSNGANSLTSSQMFGGKFFAILVPICGPITTTMIPLTMAFFKKLDTIGKLLGVTNIVIQCLLSISAGTSEGFFNIIVYFLSGFLLIKKPSRRKKQNKKVMIVIILLVIVFLIIFSNVMGNRNQGSFALSLGGNSIDWNNTILNMLPEGMQATLIYLTIYVTQGYYGFSLATTCSWYPTFGVGHSLYLLQNIEEALGFSAIDYTYMGQAEKYGWGATVNWHSAYTWIANDVSFVGVVVVMFFMGWLLNRVYSDAYDNRNPIAIGLFTMLIMFTFFIPANNKVFAAPQTFVAFWLFLTIWLLQRKIRIGNWSLSKEE